MARLAHLFPTPLAPESPPWLPHGTLSSSVLEVAVSPAFSLPISTNVAEGEHCGVSVPTLKITAAVTVIHKAKLSLFQTVGPMALKMTSHRKLAPQLQRRVLLIYTCQQFQRVLEGLPFLQNTHLHFLLLSLH